MAQASDAISFSIALTANQQLVLFVSGIPVEAGTNVVVSHTGDFDQNELSMLIADVFGMVIRSIIDPDRSSFVTRPGDFMDKQNDASIENEAPF